MPALQPKRFTPEALAALSGHPWPGNVRELRNCVERLVMMVPGENIEADDLDLAPRAAAAASRPQAPDAASPPSRLQATLDPPPGKPRP